MFSVGKLLLKKIEMKHLGKDSNVSLWGNYFLTFGHSKIESYPECKRGHIFTACIKLHWFLICLSFTMKHKAKIEKNTLFKLAIHRMVDRFVFECFGVGPSLQIDLVQRKHWPITYWPYGLENFRAQGSNKVVALKNLGVKTVA